MAHYLGKIDLSKMIGVKMADVDIYDRKVKCLVIPMEDNGIKPWGEEIQLWFRAFAYRQKKGRFSHFLMRYVPMREIRRMSAKQIEEFANNSIGAMMKTSGDKDSDD